MNRMLASLALLVASLTGVAYAAPADTEISVTGSSTVSMMPDEATVNAQVQTRADTSAAAVNQNNARYEAIVSALTRNGIQRDDITLSYYNLNYVPKPAQMPPNPNPYDRFGYTVTRSFAVKVRHMTDAGKVVDAATSAGATSIDGVTFGLAKPENARSKATRNAVADARMKAEELASAAGLHVTGIRSIQLEGAPVMRPMMMAKMAPQAAGTPTELDAGNVTVSANVTVVFSASP